MPMRRFASLLRLAWARVVGRTRVAPQRVVLTVLGVGLAVGLMVAVTGVSLGLASQSVVESDDVQYWILPENANVQSVAVSTDGLQLGDVHATSQEISTDSRVEYSLPVLLELLPVRDQETGERTYILAMGVVAEPDASVLGLSTSTLSAGDPYFANGTYNGTWTGEIALSEAAATVTNASVGSSLTLDKRGVNRSFTVANISGGDVTTGAGATPVALLHLSELQTVTGAATGDQADQILVSTDDSEVKEDLEQLYPQTSVVTQSGLGAQSISTSNLPLAVAVAAFVAAAVVGVLFVTTLMGLEVSASRHELGTLAAIGFPRRSLSLLIAAETIIAAMLGGLVGVVLGVLAILGVNAFGHALLGVETVARFDIVLLGYALVVTVLIGIVGALYPALLGRRTDALEVLRR
ncbi:MULTISPECIES: ABC transporter permease [Salinibaculum]|uniref:ABC transporter permease n=1 Tax=Salinibaculum TaxID=2732368 RepID=UPI0030CE9F97